MQTDDLWHLAGYAVAKVSAHGIAHHLPQLLDGIALSGDGMAEGGGDETTVHLVLTHFFRIQPMKLRAFLRALRDSAFR